MTVRVNKSPFNLREKLSELTSKFGLKGTELARAETAQDARDLVSAGRKNLIFNGDMKVSQRGTSFTASQEYTLDRWRVNNGGISALTTTQSSSGLGIHPNSLKVECTLDASVAEATDTWIRYGMEQKDFENAINYPSTNKSLSLSFWARANTAGQYSVCITSGDFGDRFIHAFTLNANSWEYKTVTIPAANQWGYSADFGLRLYFDLGSGSNYQNSTLDQWIYSGSTYAASGNTRVCGVNGRTFEVTGVQLEVGKNATEFEYRPYGEELTLCQRYFYINGGGEYKVISHAFAPATNEIAVAWSHPTEMRASPTVDVVGTETTNKNVNFYFRTINNTGVALTGNGRSITQMTKHHASLWFNGLTGVPQVPGQIRINQGKTAHIHLSAEL